MDLLLLNGREKPDELVDDGGFCGPVLHGVDSIQQRYRDTTTVKFDNIALAESAMRQTGWPVWDEQVLEIVWQDDLVEICDEVGKKTFYGDVFLREISIDSDINDIFNYVSNIKKDLNIASMSVMRVLNEIRPKS